MDETVLGAEEVHEGAEVHDLDYRAFVDMADLGFGRDRLIEFIAALIDSALADATLTVPSSSMLILAPVFSTISRMTLPPVPMTSRT